MTVSRVERFSQEDLDLFSRASGDTNPLHMSALYAARTAYGQPVVFGALGCLACLGSAAKPDRAITRLVADFHRPIFRDVDYRIEATQSVDGTVARLFDGSTPVLTTTVKFEAEERSFTASHTLPVFQRETAQVRRWEELRPGQEIEGLYRADGGLIGELCKRWSLGIAPTIVEALLWSSYFVGMELPGESALFFRASMDFHSAVSSGEPLLVRAKILSLNSSLAQVRSSFELLSKGKAVVSGQLTAFVRPEMAPLQLSDDERQWTNSFAGKVAVVIGASRGLGAALAMTLAAEGAQVVGVSRSKATWISNVPKVVADRITFWEGDAGDTQSLVEVEGIAAGQFGRLDFLICSAFPAITPFRLEPSAAMRIQNYLSSSTKLVLSPLSVFLHPLSRSGGCTVLISSAAVSQPVRDWPHYVAAKSAAEALCRIAPMQYPETRALIVRPERLLTEMTNTPMGRRGATPPLELAMQISTRLQLPPRAGTCDLFEPRKPEAEGASNRELTASLEPSLN